MNKILMASLLAVATASAQLTGDYGRAGMMGGYSGSSGFTILAGILWVGLTLLVWLWVVKLWKEIRKMK